MCRAFEQLEERGIQIGEKRGIQIGEKRGIQIGEKRGIQIGKEHGIKIGENRVNSLYSFLISKNRYDDLKRAIEDFDYRQTLYKEM